MNPNEPRERAERIRRMPFWARAIPRSDMQEFAEELVALGVFESVDFVLKNQPPECAWSTGPVWPPTNQK